MHLALHVPEITSRVCELLLGHDAITPASRVSTTAVAGLARTCSAVYAPANHALWRTVTHLAVFVSCTMPRGLWNRARMPPDLQDYRYQASALPSARLQPARAIQPGDLERARFCAPLIRTLCIGLNWSVQLVADGYASCFRAAGGDLFPNPRALAWNADYVESACAA
ncbi:hypothetical protein HDZ31DRAFT_62370 [Schizophyllum fasciatum]